MTDVLTPLGISIASLLLGGLIGIRLTTGQNSQKARLIAWIPLSRWALALLAAGLLIDAATFTTFTMTKNWSMMAPSHLIEAIPNLSTSEITGAISAFATLAIAVVAICALMMTKKQVNEWRIKAIHESLNLALEKVISATAEIERINNFCRLWEHETEDKHYLINNLRSFNPTEWEHPHSIVDALDQARLCEAHLQAIKAKDLAIRINKISSTLASFTRFKTMTVNNRLPIGDEAKKMIIDDTVVMVRANTSNFKVNSSSMTQILAQEIHAVNQTVIKYY